MDPCGSRPEVGSSRISRDGSPSRDCAKTTLCLIPLEYPLTLPSARSDIPTIPSTLSASDAADSDVIPETFARYSRYLLPVTSG